MPAERRIEGVAEFLSTHARVVEQLYVKAGAARWGVSRERFAESLQRSAAHRFRGALPDAAEMTGYLESLQVQDLALACACRDANEQAWEYFIEHYRQDLYAASRAIVGSSASGANEARARELADSLYAELYGLETDAASEARSAGPAGTTRRSLFDYFHGRSKLGTWLRAVLAQRHVDAFRAARRTESLEEISPGAYGTALPAGARGAAGMPDPDRAGFLALLQAALREALAALPPRDRLRLAYYYVQELTLAQIGRLLGEHEATASRHLERTRRGLRASVERSLREGKHLSEAQIRLCLEYAAEEWPFDLTGALDGSGAPKSEPKGSPDQARSAEARGPVQSLPRLLREKE